MVLPLHTDILKDADLSQTSAKKVRKELEDRFGVDLLERKKEIDSLVMDYVDSRVNDEESDGNDVAEASASDVEKEEKKKPATKRKAGPKKSVPPPPAKKKRTATAAPKNDESGSGSEKEEDDDNYHPKKGATKGKKAKPAKKKKAAGSDSDAGSDCDWKKEPAAKGKGKGKGNSFTRAYTLSPELAKLMGEDAMPRHAVVKKVWQIIKERNLYDPKNKQFAICDSDLQKVMGVKRFRTFGMLKYLRNHFLND